MPHRIRNLRATLDELRQKLESLETLDPDTRQLLEEAVREIESKLEQADAGNMAHHGLAERLSEAAGRFESSHPTLAGVVHRLVDALAQMGI